MNTLRTTLLLTGLTALFLIVGHMLGGQNGMFLAFLLAMGTNFWAYWFSDSVVLNMYGAREIDAHQAPELYHIVQGLAQRAQTPMPRVYLIDEPTPNAFATGRNPEHAAVAATTGLLRILNREELTAVMAHEMAHVVHRDILIATLSATIAGAITMLANMAQWTMFLGNSRDNRENNSGIVGLLMLILAPMAAMLIQLAISRSREYAADLQGARLCGNPLWLAGALHKLEIGNQRLPMQAAHTHPATAQLFIVNPLSAGMLATLFATHPPMEERIQRLHNLASHR
ncbi:MAG: zinc metalloprotease HtpX [Magnetococcus sp. DMHC-6]